MVEVAEATRYQVVIPTENFEKRNEMLPILKGFAAEMEKSIACLNPHGKAFPLTNFGNEIPQDTIQMVFWATPADDFAPSDTVNDDINQLYGNEDFNPRFISYVFEHSGIGAPLADNDGNVWGEAIGNVIYFYFDLPHMEKGDELLVECLNTYKSVYSGDIDINDILAKAREKRMYAAMDKYVEVCVSRNDGREERLQNDIDGQIARIDEYRGYLVEAMRTRQSLVDELQAFKIMKKMKGTGKPKFEAEFRSLLNNNKVSDVRVSGKKIIVTTTNLITVPLTDGTTRNLGVYKFVFFTDSGANPQITNLTRSIDGNPHPHIRNGICWGNLESAMAQLLTERQYAAATTLIIRYLEEPNVEDSWGSAIWHWPVHEQLDPNKTPFGADYEGEEEYDEEYCADCEHSPCVCCLICQDNGIYCEGRYDSDQCIEDCPCMA